MRAHLKDNLFKDLTFSYELEQNTSEIFLFIFRLKSILIQDILF